jgi:hypothetical protein
LALELDLVGHKITLSKRDADLLLAGAQAGSGSSVGSRDLATRLNDVARQSPQLRQGLVLSRPETRALQRVIETQFEAGERLLDLREALTEVLGPSRPQEAPPYRSGREGKGRRDDEYSSCGPRRRGKRVASLPRSAAGVSAAKEGRELAIDHEIISLRSGQLESLLEALLLARGSDALAVREEIGALRLIPGTIRLLPTEGELAALRAALDALADNPSEAAQRSDKRLPLDGKR